MSLSALAARGACLFLLGIFPAAARMEAGVGTFKVASARGDVPVLTYRPAGASPGSPVWIVMHGRKRDAAESLAAWIPFAERKDALLLVPIFSQASWPTSWSYATGNVMGSDRQPVARSEWAFGVVDRIFEEAVRRAGSTRTKFALYGHGAGAQFVQRYVLHMGASRLDLAVAASAGWYLLPDGEFDFPYGLRDLAVTESDLRGAFAAPLVVMVGLDDLKTNGVIRNNAQTLAQGATRVDRARFFLERARARAAEIGAPLHWRLAEVPGAGHNPQALVPAAAALMPAGR
jgi:hypothetical protein